MDYLCRRLATLLAGLVTAALMVLAAPAAFAQGTAPVSVEFTLYAPGLPSSSSVYLTGGTPALGNWAPDGVKMQRQGRDTWRAVVIFSKPMVVEYRYTLGNNVRIAADQRGQPRENFMIRTRRNLDVRDEVFAWTDENTVVEDPGRVTGEVRYHRHVRDETVQPRDLVVWLPRFYELQNRRDYPVLYVNDGQDIFDPSTARGGRDWGIDEAVHRMIEDDLIEPMIVVGIFSTEDRLTEYSPQDDGEAYMAYLVNTVKPLIDRRYRTRRSREDTWIAGAAMGGLIAFATAWTYPETFGGALSFSPAFRVEGRQDAIPWFAARKEPMRPVFFYLDSGALGADALLLPGVEAMVDQLRSWGYRPERNFVFVRDLEAEHGPKAWLERFPEALDRTIRGARRLEELVNQPESAAVGSAERAFLSGEFPVSATTAARASTTR